MSDETKDPTCWEVRQRNIRFVVDASNATVAALVFIASGRSGHLPGDEHLVEVRPWPGRGEWEEPLLWASPHKIEAAIEKHLPSIQGAVRKMRIPE